jgi:tetratricopeptide (TPR) repeat protein
MIFFTVEKSIQLQLGTHQHSFRACPDFESNALHSDFIYATSIGEYQEVIQRAFQQAKVKTRLLTALSIKNIPNFPFELGISENPPPPVGTAWKPQLLEQLTQIPKKHIKIAVMNGFGSAMGDSVIGLTALRTFYQILSEYFEKVQLDVYLRFDAVERLKLVYQQHNIIDNISGMPVDVSTLLKYDAFVDFSGIISRYDQWASHWAMIDFYFAKLGIDPAKVPPLQKRNLLQLNKQADQAVITTLADLRNKGKLLLFHPQTSSPTRSIPPEHYARFLKHLIEKTDYFIISVIPISFEHPRFQDISNISKSFHELCSIVSHCDAILCADTAVYHLADAFNIPTVALFSSIEPPLRIRYYPTVIGVLLAGAKESPYFRKHRMENNLPVETVQKLWEHLDLEMVVQQLDRISQPQLSLTIQTPLFEQLSKALFKQQKLSATSDCFEQIVFRSPTVVNLGRLGDLYRQQTRWDDAIQTYQQILKLEPNHLEIIGNLGITYKANNNLEEAIKCYQNIIELDPKSLPAWGNLGNVYQEQKRFDDALFCYQKTLDLDPNNPMTYNNIGNLYLSHNKPQEAVKYYQQSVVLGQKYPSNIPSSMIIDAYCNLGNALAGLNQIAHADQAYQKALQLDPTYLTGRWNRSLTLLKGGEWYAGWEHYESRIQKYSDRYPQLPKPRWNGEPLNGRRLLVYWEQGYGDSIQFVRYLPYLSNATVILVCQPALGVIFQWLAGADQVIPAPKEQGWKQTEFDLWTPLLSLPLLLSKQINPPLVTDIPYLFADPNKIKTWNTQINKSKFNVGIVWAGNPQHPNDQNRSCPLEKFVFLADFPDIQVYSLQKNQTDPKPDWIIDLDQQLQDFSDTAAILANLDLIICVDTALTHLAGALGRKVWLLLPFSPDWRWLMGGTETPWYSTIKLYRQPSIQDWDSVFETVKNDLKTLLKHRETRQVEKSQNLIKQANQAHISKNYAESLTLYQQAIDFDNKNVDAWHNRGVSLFENGNIKESMQHYLIALQLQPLNVECFTNLGSALQRQEKLKQATVFYRYALQLKSDYVEAMNNLGTLLEKQNKLEEALQWYQKAIETRPNYPHGWLNLGAILEKKHQTDQAKLCYEKAIEVKKDFPEALNNLGRIYDQNNDLKRAAELYQKALSFKSDYSQILFNSALLLFKLGDWEKAWALYEHRSAAIAQSMPHLQKPQWDGNPLNGKRLLVHFEQGFGDILQFLRYLPMLKQTQQGTIIFACPTLLKNLLENFAGIDELIVNGLNREPNVNYDVWIPLLSLGRIFQTTLENLPRYTPYVYANPQKALIWQHSIKTTGLKVGLIWAGNPRHKNDHHRSCHLKQLAPLFEVSGIQWFSLQKGEAEKQLYEINSPVQIVACAKELNDFSDTAAAMLNMDLIISVDTSTAHLAGALGRNTWILLPFAPDWRWLMDRTDSVWYPNAKLFRQSKEGDWTSIIEIVKNELKQLVIKKNSSQPPLSQQTVQYLQQGDAFVDQKNHLQAIDFYKQAHSQTPDHFITNFKLASSYLALEQYPAAIDLYRKSLIYRPEDEAAWNNLGGAYRSSKDFHNALICNGEVLKLNPFSVQAYSNRGFILQNAGKPHEAIATCRVALGFDENYSGAYNNLGLSFNDLNIMPESQAAFRQAIISNKEQDALAHLNLSLTLLKNGEFSTGWEEYEWRCIFEKHKYNVHKKPRWNGEELKKGKKLLIQWEQGLGDTIQFVRYVQLIENAEILLTCQKNLEPLLKDFPNVQTLIPQPDIISVSQEFDMWIPLLSLPRIFKTNLSNIPHKVPYLFADPEKVKKWKDRLSTNKLKIGIAWAGNPKHPNDRNRSCPINFFSNLAKELSEIEWYSLQKGSQAQQLTPEMNIISLENELSDFSETAAVLKTLDLIISVDTSIIHLAGALGCNTWVLLPFAPDWRWLLGRKDSPWYPSLRLFRQPIMGDWENVFDAIKHEIEIITF